MDYLRHSSLFNLYCHVGSVGADLYAGLAYRLTPQAPLVRVRFDTVCKAAMPFAQGRPVPCAVIAKESVKADPGYGCCCRLRIRYRLYDSGGTPAAVAYGVDMLQVGFHVFIRHRAASFLCGNTEAPIHFVVYLLSNCGDDYIRWNFHALTRGDRRTSAAFVRLSQLHHLADKASSPDFYRREKLHKLDSVFERSLKLLLVGRHISFRPSVYQPYVLHPGHSLCRPGRVHSSITASDDGDILCPGHIFTMLLDLIQKFQGIKGTALLQRFRSLLPGSSSYDEICIALGLKSFERLHPGPGPYLGPVGQT